MALPIPSMPEQWLSYGEATLRGFIGIGELGGRELVELLWMRCFVVSEMLRVRIEGSRGFSLGRRIYGCPG
jgi:hypothetical protein